MELAVIIVNWNGRELLEACLSSLQEQIYSDFGIVLVDNGSVDGSLEFLKNNFPEVEVIALSENTGFAKANNIGISFAFDVWGVDGVVLLNNDTTVEKDFLRELVDFWKEALGKNRKRVGALAPKILLQQKEGNRRIVDAVGTTVSLEGLGYNIGNGEIDNGQYDKSREVFGFCGAAALLTKKMLEDVLLFDDYREVFLKDGGKLRYKNYFADNFFAYYEDTDLNCRLRLREWQVWTVPRAVVYHIHSATASPFSLFKAYYLNRNRFLMIFRNCPKGLLKRTLEMVPQSYLSFLKTKKEKNYLEGGAGKNFWQKSGRRLAMVVVLFRVFLALLVRVPIIWRERQVIQKRATVTSEKFGLMLSGRFD